MYDTSKEPELGIPGVVPGNVIPPDPYGAVVIQPQRWEDVVAQDWDEAWGHWNPLVGDEPGPDADQVDDLIDDLDDLDLEYSEEDQEWYTQTKDCDCSPDCTSQVLVNVLDLCQCDKSECVHARKVHILGPEEDWDLMMKCNSNPFFSPESCDWCTKEDCFNCHWCDCGGRRCRYCGGMYDF